MRACARRSARPAPPNASDTLAAPWATRGHSTAEFRPPRAPTSPPVASSSPRSPSPTPDGPRQLERGGRAAALRAAGDGRRFLCTPPKLNEAPAPPVAAGARTQRPECTATSDSCCQHVYVGRRGGMVRGTRNTHLRARRGRPKR